MISENLATWKISGYCMLMIRFVQGWIFWGGGSRRFIYAPQKLDPYAPSWMANKLEAAMPGAIMGFNYLINFLLQHFFILYAAIILLSVIEFISGIALIVGFCTRLAAFATAILSICFMFTFGWQGSTCMDEWTMSICNIAMGMTLMIFGSSVYSIDAWFLQRYPLLMQRRGVGLLMSAPLSNRVMKVSSLVLLLFVIFFTLATYNYFRGAIFTAYHEGPVNPAIHHLALSNPLLKEDGTIAFTAYVDSGTPATSAYIMRITLKDENGKLINRWEAHDLHQLTNAQIQNQYQYNRFQVGEFTLEAPVGAKAHLIFKPTKTMQLKPGSYIISVQDMNGTETSIPVSLK